MSLNEGSSLMMKNLLLASQNGKPYGVLPFMNDAPVFDMQVPGQKKKSKVLGQLPTSMSRLDYEKMKQYNWTTSRKQNMFNTI